MSGTYTQHKLTDAQLIRLSQMVNSRKHNYGVAMQALERKGLAVEKHGTGNFGSGHTMAATNAGAKALQQARAEGW